MKKKTVNRSWPSYIYIFKFISSRGVSLKLKLSWYLTLRNKTGTRWLELHLVDRLQFFKCFQHSSIMSFERSLHFEEKETVPRTHQGNKGHHQLKTLFLSSLSFLSSVSCSPQIMIIFRSNNWYQDRLVGLGVCMSDYWLWGRGFDSQHI